MWWSFLLVRRLCLLGSVDSAQVCLLCLLGVQLLIVAATGVDGSQEAEGHDKTSLTLPGTQLAMLNDIEAAVAGTQKPVILGVMGGSAVDLTSMKASPTIRSIVWLGYPGQAGGAAIAKALYGAENKFGKLPITFYDEQFCTAANLTDYRMRPDPGTGYPVRATVLTRLHQIISSSSRQYSCAVTTGLCILTVLCTLFRAARIGFIQANRSIPSAQDSPTQASGATWSGPGTWPMIVRIPRRCRRLLLPTVAPTPKQ